MHIRHFSYILCVGLAAALLAGGPVRSFAQGEDTVAVVNGDKITEAQLVAELESRYGYEVRDTLIMYLVIDQEAKKRGVTITDAEVDDAYAKAKANVEALGQGTFEDGLASQGLTIAAYRGQLRSQLLLQKMVADKVTDDQVKKAYQSLPPLDEALRMSYINVATEDDATKLRADLVAGKLTWEQAAAQYNLDPYGRVKGTDLGWIPLAKIPADMLAVLQKNGDISQPIQGNKPPAGGGEWNLWRRDDYRPQGLPPFEQVEADLRHQLVVGAAQDWLGALMETADIKRLGDYKKPGS
jgi:foldase protein PrsA